MQFMHMHEPACNACTHMNMNMNMNARTWRNAYRFYRVAYRFAYRFFVEQVHVHVCARMYVRIKIDHKGRTKLQKAVTVRVPKAAARRRWRRRAKGSRHQRRHRSSNASLPTCHAKSVAAVTALARVDLVQFSDRALCRALVMRSTPRT